jgi:hypothetical protein
MSDARPPLDPSNPEPHIDLMKIDFPTDNLTVKTIRRLFPQIDSERLNNFEKIELDGMLSLERDLAKVAFDQVLKRDTMSWAMSGEEEEMLGWLYVRYGLANGPRVAEELIRKFQQSAAEQAREHLPPNQRSQSR